MTQEALADRIADLLGTSFSASTLSRIEKGKNPYNQRQLEAAAEALRCDPADLINRDPNDPAAVRSLDDYLKKASPEKRREILNVVEVMLKAG